MRGKGFRGGPRRRRRWGPLALLALGGLAAVLFAAHAAVTHWLLSGPRLRAAINTTPETTWIDWDEATSYWPGRVRLRNLRIRGSDRNVQWIIRLAQARADYSMTALWHRRFRVERVVGQGLSFRLRQKLDPSDPGNPPASWLPPIQGFSDPPLRRKPEAEAPAAAGNPWTVEVSGISLERFEEIWIDAYRFEGLARLRGGFLLRPGLRARVGPADVEIVKGKLALATQPVSTALAGDLHASFDEWDPRRVEGDAIWRSVSARVDLHGPVQGLGFLNVPLRHSEEPRFSQGSGVLSIAGTIDHGTAAGRVHLAASGSKTRLKSVDLLGNVRADLRIVRWDLEHGGMDVSSSSLQFSDAVAPGVEGPAGWWGRLALLEGRIQDGLRAKVRLECRDARPLLAAFDTDLPSWTGGLRTLDRLTATAEVRLSSEKTRISNLIAEGGKYRIVGEYARLRAREVGIFLITGGVLTAGVKTEEGHASLHLFGARRWYSKEKTLAAFNPRRDGEESTAPPPVTSVTKPRKRP